MTSTSPFRVRAIAATRKGKFIVVREISFATRAGAIDACEDLQDEFDEDSAVVRVYVLDGDGVAVHAAGRIRQPRRAVNA
jgi:hypothetical protein